MKVRALCRINYNGEWHVYGEEFEISTTDAETLDGLIQVAETPLREETKPEQHETPKRGRKKKADAE